MPAPNSTNASTETPPVPAALLSRNPLAWLRVFGPGAVVASLTIGTGELVFSTRAGVLFGERILWVFLATTVLKWVLVFSAARHFVVSGVHPLARWSSLPGPRGWFPILLALFALPAFPIWIGFHAGVTGTLVTSVAPEIGRGVASIVLLLAVLSLALAGGYRTLERIQLTLVLLLVAGVAVTVLALRPDLGGVLSGLFLPGPLHYPEWLGASHPDIAARSVWIESGLYVGVIGGSGFDYLAYTSYLRDKGWGRAAVGPRATLKPDVDRDPSPTSLRAWIRAPLIDCTASFAVVLAVSVAFVLCASLVLAPRHELPSQEKLLTFQARFFTEWSSSLRFVWIAGAFIAMLGTLYGTIEVAPALARELARAIGVRFAPSTDRRLRRAVLLWCGLGGLAVAAWSALPGANGEPPSLVEIVTPANLFTGLFACGLISLLNPWTDRRFLDRGLRMPRSLALLNVVAGVLFLALGLKAYWAEGVQRNERYGGWIALAILAVPVALAFLIARARRRLLVPTTDASVDV